MSRRHGERPGALLIAALALTSLPGCNGLLGGLGGGFGGGGLGGSGSPYTGNYTGSTPGPLPTLGGFTPSSPTSSPGVPPAMNTPGSASPRSPTSLLPPPQAGSAAAQKVFAAYKIPIYGAGASPPVLDVVADGMRHYRPENLQGLDRIVIQSRNGGSLDGQWSSDGRSTEVLFIANQARREPVTVHTVTHEFGHHWSLFTDEQGAKVFDQALGDGPQAYVSDYSRTTWEDKLAEAIAFMLIGYDRAEQPPLPGWNPSQQAFGVLQQRIVQGRPSF